MVTIGEAQMVTPSATGEKPLDAAAKPPQEGLLRIRVHANGKRTSVSLDEVLYHFLMGRLGGAQATERWVQDVVLQIERLAELGMVTPPRDVDASLSRLVQRQALRLLWGSAAGPR